MAERSWGLAAIARAGQVELEIDQLVNDRATFALTVSLPSSLLRFAIAGPAVAFELSQFLSSNHGRAATASLRLGTLSAMSVHIVKDDEFPDRFFLRVTAEDRVESDGLVEVTIVDPTTSDLVAAARSLAADVDR